MNNSEPSQLDVEPSVVDYKSLVLDCSHERPKSSTTSQQRYVKRLCAYTHSHPVSMPDKFQLFYSAQSPYVRKVTIAARLLGLNDRIERVPTTTSEVTPPVDLISANPLGKVPTLVVISDASGARRPVFDSSIILQYLDSIADKRDTLYPPSSDPGRIEALNYEALADGILDAAWLFRAESVRPESERSAQWIAGQLNKIRRGVEALGALPEPEFPSVQAVVLACTLWYLLRRLPDSRWQELKGGQKLEAWYRRAVQEACWVEEGEVPPS